MSSTLWLGTPPATAAGSTAVALPSDAPSDAQAGMPRSHRPRRTGQHRDPPPATAAVSELAVKVESLETAQKKTTENLEKLGADMQRLIALVQSQASRAAEAEPAGASSSGRSENKERHLAGECSTPCQTPQSASCPPVSRS